MLIPSTALEALSVSKNMFEWIGKRWNGHRTPGLVSKLGRTKEEYEISNSAMMTSGIDEDIKYKVGPCSLGLKKL